MLSLGFRVLGFRVLGFGIIKALWGCRLIGYRRYMVYRVGRKFYSRAPVYTYSAYAGVSV